MAPVKVDLYAINTEKNNPSQNETFFCNTKMAHQGSLTRSSCVGKTIITLRLDRSDSAIPIGAGTLDGTTGATHLFECHQYFLTFARNAILFGAVQMPSIRDPV